MDQAALLVSNALVSGALTAVPELALPNPLHKTVATAVAQVGDCPAEAPPIDHRHGAGSRDVSPTARWPSLRDT